MNNFFKTFFASCLGAFVALLAGVFLVAVFGVGAAMGGEQEYKVAANSVLQLTFEDPIPELTNNLPADGFSFSNDAVLGLQDILDAIDKAADDKNIKGILIEPKFGGIGQAKAKVLREKFREFAESGKFVYAKGDNFSQSGYYLASAADKVYMNPLGMLDLRGYAAQIPFFKDMLDRLGVKAQVFYAGQFKSATEPFRRNDISEQNRLQIREFLSDRYNLLLDHISTSRNIDRTKLKSIIDGYEVRDADDAVKYGLIDELVYQDQFLELLRDKMGVEEKDKINFVDLEDYYNPAKDRKSQKAKDKIAVVYAEGSIVDGESQPGNIQGTKYAKIFAKIRKDEAVKAIVMRVNSGGGSGFASEKILREIEVCQEKGIPVVVSFGDVAASGGYYISLSADSIFAEPNTLTGSIGVFAMIPSVQKMMKDKMGISFDTVSTGPFAAGFTPFFDFNDRESAILQNYIDNFYDDFIKRVGDGRDMTKEEVHKIAQGRVWTGMDAIDNGLVDAMGGMDEALSAAANLAGIQDYKVRNYPKVKNKWEQLLEEVTGGSGGMVKEQMLKSEFGEYYKHYDWLMEVATTKGPQARIPFILE